MCDLCVHSHTKKKWKNHCQREIHILFYDIPLKFIPISNIYALCINFMEFKVKVTITYITYIYDI